MKPTTRTTATSLASIFLLTGAAFAAPGDILFGTEFNTPADLEGWTDTGDRLVGFDGTGQEAVITNGDGDGVFAAQISAGDPQLAQTGLSIDHALTGRAVARLRKSDGAGGWLTDPATVNADLLLFSGPNSGGNQSAPDSKVADETVAGDGWIIAEWDLSHLVTGTITGIRWDPLQGALGDSFEIDYFRIIEIDPATARLAVAVDPGDPIPAGFSLAQAWDTAAELSALSFANLSPTLGGTPGVSIGPCTIDVNEDCILGFTTNGDSQLTSPGGLAIPVAADEEMIIEYGLITNSGTGTTTHEMFWNDGSGGFGGPRRILFGALPADDAAHVLRITFRDGKLATQLNQLRYDPSRDANDIQIEVDYIRIYTNATLPPLLNWDSDTVTAGAQGGTATWDTTNPFFYDSANMVNVTWPTTPGGDDNAVFGATAGTVTIDTGGITAHSLVFETDGYVIDGGELSLDSSATAPFFSVANALSAEISSDIIGDDDNARKTGLGALTLSGTTTVNSFTVAGGTLTVPSGTLLETLGTNPAENNFALKLTGAGTLNIDGIVDAGSGDFGGFSGDSGITVNLNPGGELTTTNAIAGWNAVATYNFNGGTSTIDGQFRHQDGGSGTINISDGTHEVTGLMGAICNGNGGNATINISGGTITAGAVGFNVGTAGAALGTNTMSVNLTGGVLETDQVYLNRGPSTSTSGDNTLNLVLDGGTLRASPDGASPDLIEDDLGNTALDTLAFNVTIGSNGVTIDTNGQNKSIGQNLIGTNGGDLTKNGAGNLYLDGECDYDGSTILNAGNLGGSGSTFEPVVFGAGTGLARRITDPATPGPGLLIEGELTVPDPLVIAVDSAGAAPFPETSATGIVVVEGFLGILGFNPATVTIDTSDFTGLGTWTARLDTSGDNEAIVLDYVAGADPFAVFMDAAFPGETDPLIVGPSADPDQDGVTNIEEFGFAGNPDDATDNGPGSTGINDVGGTDYLTITVAVRIGATFSGTDAQTATVDSVLYTIDGSADLENFDSVVTEVAPAITAGLPDAPTNYEYRTFRLNPDTAAGVGFLRAGATGAGE